eukprot:TRINITY_DN29178_c0_g1_i1.p1 TRINITY_DN29178_c0_g1~~TRINITY_DN29178_c0_g1_i1.p1  ORF type:complete len:339 (-),score=34.47 TRINITY_DN29178_c0_g1_i1:197-1213(-)
MPGILGQVFGNKSDDPEAIALSEQRRKDREAIIQGLAQSRVVWSGGACTDCYVFIKQTHIIFGIFACHRMHPYSRCERFFVWLSLAIAGLGLSFMYVGPDGKHGKDIGALAAGSVVSVWLSLMHVILQQASMARCCVEGGFCYCWGAGKLMANFAGKIILFGGLLFAALCFIGGLGVALARSIPLDKTIAAWCVSQIYSSVWGVFISIGMYFYRLYGCCCCNPCGDFCGTGQGLKPAVQPDWCYPHGPEHPKDVYLFWEGDRCGCYRPDGATSSTARAEAEDAPVVGVVAAAASCVEVVMLCRHGCGRPTFKTYDTCCTHCKGAAGPHAHDCKQRASE